MVPLDTNAFLTAWLPLRSLSQADSALTFASGSHRDFALPYWHTDDSMNAGLERRGFRLVDVVEAGSRGDAEARYIVRAVAAMPPSPASRPLPARLAPLVPQAAFPPVVGYVSGDGR